MSGKKKRKPGRSSPGGGHRTPPNVCKTRSAHCGVLRPHLFTSSYRNLTLGVATSVCSWCLTPKNRAERLPVSSNLAAFRAGGEDAVTTIRLSREATS